MQAFLPYFRKKCQYLGYSSRGGENWTKTDVKLACKTVFVQFSTSGGRPMLLVSVVLHPPIDIIS